MFAMLTAQNRPSAGLWQARFSLQFYLHVGMKKFHPQTEKGGAEDDERDLVVLSFVVR